MRAIACLLLLGVTPARAQNWTILVDGGSCTLQKALAFANAGNGVSGASVGSATTTFAECSILASPTPITAPQPGSYGLLVQPSQLTLATIDNDWYGPNALPPIACDITIFPGSGTLRLIAAHTGDPSPTTANAFRFFYISGGLSGTGLPAGHLSIYDSTLQNGYAKGGNSGGFNAGGGAGMGGAIFNQGALTLVGVTLLGNTAHGGNQSGGANLGGGGIGQDALDQGGGFGGSVGTYGGSGAITDGCRGGGGGGFTSGSSGSAGTTSSGTGGSGGGLGGLGGSGGTASSTGGNGGDGGGGGGGVSSGVGGCPAPPPGQDGRGGNFGSGGKPGGYQVASLSLGAGGGGGVGGGGGGGYYGTAGGGGGFGGGGGASDSGTHGGTGGFGGGNGGFGGGPGGAGMGGAIFNHRGTASLLNVTAYGNAAIGGARAFVDGTADGGGLGAVLFNLNGTVTIDFSTLAGNALSGTNANDDAHGRSDGTVYSLAYGSVIESGGASTAVLTINSSIIHGTHADAGNASDDVVVNVVGGNASSFQFLGSNVVGATLATGGVTQTLPSNAPVTADPQLGALSVYSSAQYPLPVLPVGANGSSSFAADNGHCLRADGVTNLGTDERGTARPYNGTCNAGAYQFNGNYVFANGFEPMP